MNYWKLLVSVLVFAYCLYYVGSLDEWHFIDNVNLITHEGGHLLFMPFGELLMLLGGTILQLLVPIIFIIYFFIRQQNFSASILLFWLAINFFNVSVYSGDALTRSLPLITGDPDTHDWNQILFILGWFKHTALISGIFYVCGWVSMIAGLLLGIVSSGKEKSLSL